MTKIFKKLFVLVAVLALTLTLTGCGFASKAQKLEDQFAAGEEFSLADVKDTMGDPTSEALILGSGLVVWVDGCENEEELKALIEAEESAAALVVTVVANKVTSVDFVEEYKGEAK